VRGAQWRWFYYTLRSGSFFCAGMRSDTPVMAGGVDEQDLGYCLKRFLSLVLFKNLERSFFTDFAD
jgi:hypothetical protein